MPSVRGQPLAEAVFRGRPASSSKTTSKSVSASSILPRIRVVDYGVLGTQLAPGTGIGKLAEPPDDFTAFVDPAGLPFIRSGPGGAGGASGSIYDHIGIRGDGAFPEDVRKAVTEECKAHYHRYQTEGGVHHVVHTVGPMLGQGKYTWDEAVAKLAGAYRNVLAQYARFAAIKAALAPKGTTVRLRLLPISGGIFAGDYQQRIAPLTLAALQAGIGLLTEEECSVLAKDETQIELCVFLAVELAAFRAAMAEQLLASGASSEKPVRKRKPTAEAGAEPEAAIQAILAARQQQRGGERQIEQVPPRFDYGTTHGMRHVLSLPHRPPRRYRKRRVAHTHADGMTCHECV